MAAHSSLVPPPPGHFHSPNPSPGSWLCFLWTDASSVFLIPTPGSTTLTPKHTPHLCSLVLDTELLQIQHLFSVDQALQTPSERPCSHAPLGTPQDGHGASLSSPERPLTPGSSALAAPLFGLTRGCSPQRRPPTWYTWARAQHPAPCPEPSAQRPAPRAQHQVPSAQSPEPSIQHPEPRPQRPASSAQSPASSTQCCPASLPRNWECVAFTPCRPPVTMRSTLFPASLQEPRAICVTVLNSQKDGSRGGSTCTLGQ